VSAADCSAFFRVTGWRREDVLQRLISPPCKLLERPLPPDTPLTACLTQAQIDQLPLVRDRRQQSHSSSARSADDDEEEDGSLQAWIPCPPVAQYPSCRRLFEELAEGARPSYQNLWRCRFADGFEYEVDCTAWAVRSDWMLQPDGSRREKPLWVMITGSNSCRVPPHRPPLMLC
jgi:hypothetical protein